MPGTFLTGLGATPFYKQYGEGEESNAIASGVDDFLKAWLGLVLRKSPLGGPPVGPSL